MLTLAFDTATDVATAALLDDDEVLGERTTRAVRLLEDVDALLRQAGGHARDFDRLAVGIGPGRFPRGRNGLGARGRPRARARLAGGIGPGSFPGVRIGLAAARGLALALDVPAAGVSTLAALAAGAPGARPAVAATQRAGFALLPRH